MITKVYLDKSINSYEVHKRWYMSYLYEHYCYIQNDDWVNSGGTMYYRL